MNEAIDYFNSDEIREAEEIRRELDERDRADAEWAHQQSLDEQADTLTIEEQKEQTLWRLTNALKDAVAFCGLEDTRSAVLATLDDIYFDSFSENTK